MGARDFMRNPPRRLLLLVLHWCLLLPICRLRNELSLRRRQLLRYLLRHLLLHGSRAIPGINTLRWVVPILRRCSTHWIGLNLGLHLDLLSGTPILVVGLRSSSCHSVWSAVATILAMTGKSHGEKGKADNEEDAETESVMPNEL